MAEGEARRIEGGKKGFFRVAAKTRRGEANRKGTERSDERRVSGRARSRANGEERRETQMEGKMRLGIVAGW